VDPVTADSNTGAMFNRYWYANGNPYKFTDPDGRDGEFAYGASVGLSPWLTDEQKAFIARSEAMAHQSMAASGIGMGSVISKFAANGEYSGKAVKKFFIASIFAMAIHRPVSALNSSFIAPTIFRNVRGQLTNGKYILDETGMAKHMTGKPGASQFLFNVDARRAVLDAAAYADEAGLWIGSKAKVPAANGSVGVLGESGELTSYINVYRTRTGQVHGSPGTSPKK
jgi:hypothetical protein